MAQFSVYRRKDGAPGLFMDCQSDHLDGYSTRFTAPLQERATADFPASRLNPIFEIKGTSYVMYTHFAAAMPQGQYGDLVASLPHKRDRVIAAFDLLLTGV